MEIMLSHLGVGVAYDALDGLNIHAQRLHIAFGECADYILKICILQYVKESLENHSKKCSKQKRNTAILT